MEAQGDTQPQMPAVAARQFQGKPSNNSVCPSSAQETLHETITETSSEQPNTPQHVETEESPPTMQKQARPLSHKLRHVLEAIGLSAVYNLLGRCFGWAIEEEKKTIMDRKRTLAVVRCVVHVIPALGCIVLLRLNLKNWYIGSELQGPQSGDSQKLGALQFVAKLHELFMLSSIGVVLVTHIKRELAFGDGIPFGALFSGNQFESIKILWSLEFWGLILYKWPNARKKAFTMTLIVLCSILALAVGPSSANVMKPRLDNWPAGGTDFWLNGTKDSLVSTVFDDNIALASCSIDTGDPSCPHGEWHTLNESLFAAQTYSTGTYVGPQSVDFSSASVVRTMLMRSRSQYPQTVYRNKYTSATIPYSFIADSVVRLARLWNQAVETVPGTLLFRSENDFTVGVEQPVAISRCFSYRISSNASAVYYFPVMNSSMPRLNGRPGSQQPLREASDTAALLSGVPAISNVSTLCPIGSIPSLHWIDAQELLQATKSSILVVAAIPQIGNFDPAYQLCSVEIRAPFTKVSSGQHTTQHVVGEPVRWREYRIYMPSVLWLYPRVAWTKYLNPTLARGNSTVFSTLLDTAAQWSYKKYGMHQYPEISTEIILSSLLANGIARHNFNTSILSDEYLHRTDKDPSAWIVKILPKDLNFGPGDNAFDIPADIQQNMTKMKFEVTNYGYAYSHWGMVQKAALAVLLTYVLFVTIHVVLTLWTGLSSSSWGSPSEIAALAVNSTPTTKLQNTGAGIETVTVYEQHIQLEVKSDVLHLVFHNKKRAEDLEANRPYG